MIKVCHITCSHQPEDTRIFKKECVSLANNGYEVYLVQRGKTYEKDGVKICGFEYDKITRFSRLFQLSKKAFDVAKQINADVYHFHDPELLRFGLKLKRLGKKVIFDSHECTAESIKEKKEFPSFVRGILYWIYSTYERYVCKKLDGVIYVSPNFYGFFSKLNSNVELITNYPIIQCSFRQTVPEKTRLFYAGNISDQWSQKQILTAIGAVHDARYLLCGRVEESYFLELQKHPSWSFVDYCGLVSHQDVHDLMMSSSIGMSLLQPSDNTNWYVGTLGNTKIFEQMMAGIPVICTNFTLWKAIVDKYKCGICVNPNSIESIINSIKELSENKTKNLEMGKNARRAVEEEYNWKTQEQKLIEFYKNLF